MRRLFLLTLALLFAGLAYGCDLDGPTDREDDGIALQLVAEGLTAPVMLTEPPDGSGRLFVVDQIGQIRIVTAEGELVDEPFLDLTGEVVDLMPQYDERGLLGLAFHPDYSANGRFFVYYSATLRAAAPDEFDHTARVEEFQVSPADANRADPASRRTILVVDQPQFNHNGGTVAFGPSDGHLYISLGDGGGANDTGTGHVEDWYAFNEGGNAQNLTDNLLGKILRIDVDVGNPYGIPADNPFVGTAGLDEIWAYGFRNPYRFSFDPGAGTSLLVGDAGQELYEEVSLVSRGGNYGWNVKEGTHCFDSANPETPPATCPNVDPTTDVPLVDPVIEFPNTTLADGLGVVVVGGHVYRGTEVPDLTGEYLFGAFAREQSAPSGRVFAALPASGAGLWLFRELAFENRPQGNLGHYLLGFGEDAGGEAYVLTTDNLGPTGSTGRVYRLVWSE